MDYYVEGQGSLLAEGLLGDAMLRPDEVAAMVRLHDLGWGKKRIAEELGCSRNTVKRYLGSGGWVAYRQPRRRRRLDGSGGLAGGALPAPPRQLRRGAAGSAGRSARAWPNGMGWG